MSEHDSVVKTGKNPVSGFFSKIQYARRPFGYWLAPVLAMVLAVLISRCAVTVTLPEKLGDYEVFFLILEFLLLGFFLLISLPCAAFSCVLSVRSVCKECHYVLPILQLLLNIGLLVCWYLVLREIFG